ncbi:DUF294 nucleotidyltransferase-like domain-containing protein [Paracandidimonas soli]|uniref:CBS domain-containing protein n=1 Tax=Paracandidimonas soli TaxID=1917182 RepID=A0A4R3UX53_9BURK|nr:DUF294 nucleotidyltransferase-like domain-containing protein [Paracandidimonas soli]TCU95228.1 CBS domain-containing protein [Paracandidimonas soli]
MGKQDAQASAKLAVAQNLQGISTFLQAYPPFDQMEPAHVMFLVEHCMLRFYPSGSPILCPADGRVSHWHLVRQGRVAGLRKGTEDEPDTHLELLPGDGFPFAAMVGERPTRTVYTAAQDTFCLVLPADDFIRLLQMSDAFRDFALRGVSGLLGELGRQIRMTAAHTLGADHSLDMALRELVAREPIVCGPDASLRAAVALMNEHRTGSIAVVDADRRPLGIFTLRDLRRVVVNPEANLDAPIAQVMTPNPYHLKSADTAFDAAMQMTRHHIAHVCIVDDGRLTGVISDRDLFALQRVDLVHLARAIRQADSLEYLQSLREGIPKLVASMLAHGASAEQVLRLVTQLNDQTTARVIELVMHTHGDPGIPFGWIAFGSEARGEQTLLTDQDNGLIFEADDDAQAQERQALLLPLAKAINHALDQCGLRLCPGDIMAGNPRLCLAGFQWRAFFSRMFQSPTPHSLLNAAIFFDMRHAWGADCGFTQMQAHAVELAANASLFQHMMAKTALENQPPVGGIRNMLGQALGFGQNTIDLKKQALTLFVDAARLLSLAHGLTVPSTVQRLLQLGERGHLEPARAQTYVEAFNYLQQLRLRHHQRQRQDSKPLDNLIRPSDLNALEQRILRSALQQARHLQDSLRLRYQL